MALLVSKSIAITYYQPTNITNGRWGNRIAHQKVLWCWAQKFKFYYSKPLGYRFTHPFNKFKIVHKVCRLYSLHPEK